MSTWREKVKSQRDEAGPSARPSAHFPAATGVSKSKNARRGGKDVQDKRKRQAAAQGGGGKRKGAASLKGQIRGLQRTLKHQGEGMTEAARAAKEEEIASLVALSDDRKRRERERELAKKYHMVKFFERRKLMRRLEKVTQLEKLPGAENGGEELRERRKALEADMHYVAHFPKDKPYVALFPSDGHTDESRAEVENIRALILSAESGVIDLTASAGTKSGGDDGGNDDDFFLEEVAGSSLIEADGGDVYRSYTSVVYSEAGCRSK